MISHKFKSQARVRAELLCEVHGRGGCYLLCRNQHRELRKMHKLKNIVETKEQNKTTEIGLNEMEISEPDSSK